MLLAHSPPPQIADKPTMNLHPRTGVMCRFAQPGERCVTRLGTGWHSLDFNVATRSQNLDNANKIVLRLRLAAETLARRAQLSAIGGNQ